MKKDEYKFRTEFNSDETFGHPFIKVFLGNIIGIALFTNDDDSNHISFNFIYHDFDGKWLFADNDGYSSGYMAEVIELLNTAIKYCKKNFKVNDHDNEPWGWKVV